MTRSAARWRDAALLLELQIQPGATRDEFVGLHGDRLKVRISAPPVDGRANRHLLEFLAAEFAVPRAHVVLLRGESSRSKAVRIDAPRTIPAIVQRLIDGADAPG